MKSQATLIIVFLLAFQLKAQNNFKSVTNIDSTLNYVRINKHYVFKMGGNIISNKQAYQYLKSYESSAYELKKSRRLSGIGLALMFASVGSFAIHSVLFIPVYFATVGLAINEINKSNKHFTESIWLYNLHACNHKNT